MPVTDRDLIARVLAGERESFHELVRRHESPLWATLRATLGDGEDSREVFQETWLRAFARLASLRDPARLRSWLLSIGLNLARQLRRRPAPLPAEGAGIADVAAAEEEPGTDLERREEVARVRAAIALLPPRQREVLDLRVNHELSHAEIAALLSISEESSRANYYQALRRLRSLAGDEDDGGGR
ncbi:MAG: sigma-70 family RNA polymerase sigma factor [Planctomycetota bacterium]